MTANIQRILVAVHHQDDGEVVLEKARQVSAATRASLHVVRVIYEAFAELSIHDIETSTELKTSLLQAEETFLEELIEPLQASGVDIKSTTIWHKAEWQGILEVAADCDAQLIIKGAQTGNESALRTPSDWNLLRHAEVPVMLVKPLAWAAHPVILAAIDATNDEDEALNLTILGRAQALATQLGGRLHVASAYPSYDRWADPATLSIDYDQVHKAIREAVDYKVAHLVSMANVKPESVHSEQGYTNIVIDKIVMELGAQLLVMGTHRRRGARGIVMGNTSEEILHAVKCDVEVLH